MTTLLYQISFQFEYLGYGSLVTVDSCMILIFLFHGFLFASRSTLRVAVLCNTQRDTRMKFDYLFLGPIRKLVIFKAFSNIFYQTNPYFLSEIKQHQNKF